MKVKEAMVRAGVIHDLSIVRAGTMRPFGVNKVFDEKKDVTVEVDTIREKIPPDLKKKLFPDDKPDDPEKVRQNASTEKKKGLRESP